MMLLVLVGTWWYWVNINWYCLLLGGSGLVWGFYACLYWKLWRFGRMSPQQDDKQTNDEQGKIELLSQWTNGRLRWAKTWAEKFETPTLSLTTSTGLEKVARIQAPTPSPRLAQALPFFPIFSLLSNAWVLQSEDNEEVFAESIYLSTRPGGAIVRGGGASDVPWLQFLHLGTWAGWSRAWWSWFALGGGGGAWLTTFGRAYHSRFSLCQHRQVNGNMRERALN